MVASAYGVPKKVHLDLRSIDSAEASLTDAQYVAALTLRKLQALRYVTKPGITTSVSPVITLTTDLDASLRALANGLAKPADQGVANGLRAGAEAIRTAGYALSRLDPGGEGPPYLV